MSDRDDLPPEADEAASRIDRFVRDTLASVRLAAEDEAWATFLPVARRMADCGVQGDILDGLLDAALDHADRAALFVVRKGRASGWSASGFHGDPVQDEIREVQVDLEQETVFREVVETRRSVAEDDPSGEALSFLRFGQTEPRAAVYVPLCASERVVGVLYGDVVGPDRALGRAALESLAIVASLAIERLLLRHKLAAPGTHPTPPAPGRAAAPPRHVRSVTADPAPWAPHPEEMPSLTLDLPAASALRDEASASDPEDDARRFARLLAMEIKLYHEQEVAAGRAASDLYHRLRDPIEASRKLYLERVESMPLTRDHFEEEIVEVLAGGNPTLLGPRP